MIILFFRKVLRTAMVYARMWFMWRAWVAWRAFVMEARRWQTPNLHKNIRHRSTLLLSYPLFYFLLFLITCLLLLIGLTRNSYIKRLERGARPNHYDLKGTFLRWAEYTQKCVRHKKMIQLAQERSTWRAARRFFTELRSDILLRRTVGDATAVEKQSEVCNN